MNGGFRQVLSFPAKADASLVWKTALGLAWETQVKPVPFDGSEDRIDVEYKMTISGWNPKEVSGAIHQTVSFAKSPSSVAFDFDTNASKISEEKFRSVYDVGKFSWPQFLSAAREEIRRLAKGNPPSRQLVRDLLDVCRNTIDDVSDCAELTRSLGQ